MNIIALALMLLLAPVAALAAPPDVTAMLKKQLSPLIKKEMANNKVKGLSIAVVSDQRVVWVQGSATRTNPPRPRPRRARCTG